MSTALLGGLTQGLGQGLQWGVQLNALQQITKARSDFFKSMAKQNEARAQIQAMRLKTAMLLGQDIFGGEQDQSGIQGQSIPGTAPMLGPGEMVMGGDVPQISQQGQADQTRRLLGMQAVLEGQPGQAAALLQPSRESFTVSKLGNKLIGVFQDPMTGRVRTQTLETGDALTSDFVSMGTIAGKLAVVLNKNTGEVQLTDLGIEGEAKPFKVTDNQLRVIQAGKPIEGIPLTPEEARAIVSQKKNERVEVAERTGAGAQERRAKAELEKTLNVTGDLFLKPKVQNGQLQFDRPKGTTSVGEAGSRGFLNVTQQRTSIEKINEAQNALRILDSIQPMVTELIQAEPGLANIISQALTIQGGRLTKSGTLTNFRNEQGKQLTVGELASVYNRRVKALTRTLGRASGEKGVFTDKDVDDFKSTLPGSLDTATTAQTFMDEQRRFFAQRIEDQVTNIFGQELTPPGIADQLMGLAGQQNARSIPATTSKSASPEPPAAQTFGDVLRQQPDEVQQTWLALEERFLKGSVSIDELRAVAKQIFGEQTETVLQFLIMQQLENARPPIAK